MSERLQIRYNKHECVWELWRIVFGKDVLYPIKHQWHEYVSNSKEGCRLYAKSKFPNLYRTWL